MKIIINEAFQFGFVPSFQNQVYFTPTEHINSEAKFSSEILDLNVDCIKFTVEKVHPRA